MNSSNPALSDYASTSSHAASDNSQAHTRNVIDPHVWTDLQRSKSCALDDLLGIILSHCRHTKPQTLSNPAAAPSTPKIPQSSGESSLENSPNGSDVTEKAGAQPSVPHSLAANKAMLEKCLQAVLPICNDAGFRRMIKAFCDASDVHETERYAPFTAACNHALERLRNLEVSDIRPPTDCSPLFHVNHDTYITGHNDSRRIPDVVAIPLAAAKRVHNITEVNADVDLAASLQKPPQGFKWNEILVFVEFKRRRKVKASFPTMYGWLSKSQIPAYSMSDEPYPGNSVVDTPTDTSISTSTTEASDSSRSQHNGSSRSGESDKVDQLPASANATIPANTSSPTGGKRRPHAEIGPEPQQPSDQGRSKRPRLAHDIREGLKQCGGYAAEMLSASVDRMHGIGLFIVDATAWVWWYDRQGAIQTTGIHLVKDLPRFVVLLLAMVRFRRDDWGYHPELDTTLPTGSQDSRSIRVGEIDLSVRFDDIIYNTLCLVGRGTDVLGASGNHPSVAGTPIVAKFSWPNKARASEKSIIEQALKVAPGAKNHLPKVFAERDFCDTQGIRKQLGISEDPQNPSRVFRVTVFERLIPITAISGQLRMTVILQCVKTHYLVWKGGVQHRDLSVSNIMVRTQDLEHLGVLNDLDLSFAEGISVEVPEHTATLLSLSLRLLDARYWAGSITVGYRHELESFIWIIFLLAKCGGAELTHSLRGWATGVTHCKAMKLLYVQTFNRHNSPTTTIEWRVANLLLEQLKFSYSAPDTDEDWTSIHTLKLNRPQSDRELLDSFLQLMPAECPVPASPALD
ncbi:hypothetical protein RhiJN_00355 [Ceratobasidium sp. AG-Ba]|nr:hypothetical protein RhiJN_00355 [Ceratobasidium sp. AG-Ba]QRW01384.1 hypothetical protein RhiLY_00381 [Ceratobasidium sp. AG-Ba]